MPLMDDEDAIRVEMAADFAKELEKLKKIIENTYFLLQRNSI